MHEMGIILHLADTLDEAAKENHIIRYGSVTLQVGEVSGILTDYFTECWDYFKKRHPLLKDSVLKLEEIKAYTHCDSCGRTYETVRYGKQCPYCQSYETWLITGNECIIKEVEAEVDETESSDEMPKEQADQIL